MSGLSEKDKELIESVRRCADSEGSLPPEITRDLLSIIEVLNMGCLFGNLAVKERDLARVQADRYLRERNYLAGELNEIKTDWNG